MRTSHLSEGTWSLTSADQPIERRLGELNREIDESKAKIDDFIMSMGNKIGHVVCNKMQKIVERHEDIVHCKDRELEIQGELLEKFKETEMNLSYQKLEAALKECQDNMQRILNVLDIYKKQSQKFKIELDIRDNQLHSCRQKEKKLIKKVWMLEEDIKDIYTFEVLQNAEPPAKYKNRAKPQTSRYRTHGSEILKSQQNTSKTIHTENNSKHRNKQLHIKINERPQTPKPSIYEVTHLNQHLKQASSARYKFNQTFMSVSSSRETHKSPKQSALLTVNQPKKVTMYDDLRHSLRSKTKIQTLVPKYLETTQRQIGLQQFNLIIINSPKILKQIQNIAISNQSLLQQVDSQAITLLNHLFSSPNSLKILEIMLFNYSLQALREIKEFKQEKKIENTYAQPMIDHSFAQQVSARLPKQHKHRVDLAIHKNFKSKCSNKKIQDCFGNRVTSK